MKYAAFGLLAAFLLPMAYGDIPENTEGWYTPKKFAVENVVATLSVNELDEYGNDNLVEYHVSVDEDGKVTGANGLDLTDAVSFENLKALQAYVLAMRNKERIATIGENLDDLLGVKGFSITNPETGQTYTIKLRDGTIATAAQDESSDGVLLPAFSDEKIAAVDGKSIVTNYNGLLSLHGYPDAALHNGKMPRYNFGNGLEWFNLAALFDGQSVSATPSAQYANLIPDGGISLAGWNAPRTGDAKCMPTLASMLQGNGAEQGAEYDGANHYVLTRYGNPGGEPVLHYTQIGDLQAGNAIKFVGTSGEAVVGRGSQTNVVTFCSATNSNVQVTVESANGNATITIGVYYK